MSDYDQRKERLGLACKDEIKALAKESSTIFLDVRSAGEVENKKLTSHKFVHAHCTMTDTSNLTSKADELLPDKDAPVVIFCGIGERASIAKKDLVSLGYTKVYNAGGLKDLGYLMEVEV